MRAAAAVSGRPGVSGQPARRQVTDEIIENIVPGYHGVQVKPGEWELVKAPSPAEGPTPGELEYGEPFPIGDGRFAVKTGEDDYEIVTPGGGQWFVDAWGNGYIQDASGKLNPVEAPTIDEQINRALVEGDAGKAMALSDFRDRPSAEERMRLAMEFARTPGDLMAISAILRGQLEPPPPPAPGETQRIAAPPDWVVDAWKDLTSAWGIPEEMSGPLPGVTPEAAAATGIGKGSLGEVGYARKVTEEFDGEIIEDLTRGPSNFAEAFPQFQQTIEQANLGTAQKRQIQEAVMTDADINMGTSFGGAAGLPTEVQAKHEAYLAGLPDELKKALTQPATAAGVQFQGQRYATPFAAALAARDAAPVVSAAAQDMANLGFGGREGNISTAQQNIADELFAKYGHLGFTHDMFHAAIQDLITTRPDLDLVGRIWAARDLLTEEWEQKHLSDILGDDYPTKPVTEPLTPAAVTAESVSYTHLTLPTILLV